jgi:hypothetical protein
VLNGRVTILSLVFLMLGGCQSYQQKEPERWSPQELDIIEAVFRYNIEGIHAPLFRVVCLSWGHSYQIASEGLDEKNDPSDEFISRFDDCEIPVKKISECDLDNIDEDGGTFCFNVVDGETGEDGIVFRVNGIRRLGASEVEVEGGYDSTCVSASGNLYTVVYDGDKWVVVDDVVLWMS